MRAVVADRDSGKVVENVEQDVEQNVGRNFRCLRHLPYILNSGFGRPLPLTRALFLIKTQALAQPSVEVELKQKGGDLYRNTYVPNDGGF